MKYMDLCVCVLCPHSPQASGDTPDKNLANSHSDPSHRSTCAFPFPPAGSIKLAFPILVLSAPLGACAHTHLRHVVLLITR